MAPRLSDGLNSRKEAYTAKELSDDDSIAGLMTPRVRGRQALGERIEEQTEQRRLQLGR